MGGKQARIHQKKVHPTDNFIKELRKQRSVRMKRYYQLMKTRKTIKWLLVIQWWSFSVEKNSQYLTSDSFLETCEPPTQWVSFYTDSVDISLIVTLLVRSIWFGQPLGVWLMNLHACAAPLCVASINKRSHYLHI